MLIFFINLRNTQFSFVNTNTNIMIKIIASYFSSRYLAGLNINAAHHTNTNTSGNDPIGFCEKTPSLGFLKKCCVRCPWIFSP